MESAKSHRMKTFNHAYFVTYGAAFIALGLSSGALGPMLPYLATMVNVSISQISFVFTAISLGYLIGSTGGGQLLDRFRGHRLMLLAVLLTMIALVLVPLSTKMPFLLTILFVLGLGQGIIDVGANTSLLWVYQKRVGPFMNALHFCFGAGAFLSPLLLHYVLRWSGGQLIWPFWSLAVLAIPGLLGLWRFPSPKSPKPETAEDGIKNHNTGLIIAIMMLFFLIIGIENGFGGWVFTYVSEAKVTTEAGASFINSIFWGALTIGRLLAVPLARKVKAAYMLLGNILLAIIFLMLLLVFPLNILAIWIGSAGLGLALSSVFPTLLVLGESRLKITGRITGLFFLGSSLGTMFVPTVMGQVFERFGSVHIITAMLTFACLGLGVLLLVIFTSSKVSKRTQN